MSGEADAVTGITGAWSVLRCVTEPETRETRSECVTVLDSAPPSEPSSSRLSEIESRHTPTRWHGLVPRARWWLPV